MWSGMECAHLPGHKHKHKHKHIWSREMPGCLAAWVGGRFTVTGPINDDLSLLWIKMAVSSWSE